MAMRLVEKVYCSLSMRNIDTSAALSVLGKQWNKDLESSLERKCKGLVSHVKGTDTLFHR